MYSTGNPNQKTVADLLSAIRLLYNAGWTFELEKQDNLFQSAIRADILFKPPPLAAENANPDPIEAVLNGEPIASPVLITVDLFEPDDFVRAFERGVRFTLRGGESNSPQP